jgi:hypothetical protein
MERRYPQGKALLPSAAIGVAGKSRSEAPFHVQGQISGAAWFFLQMTIQSL